jgi:sporulation integral membrane protein YtvI
MKKFKLTRRTSSIIVFTITFGIIIGILIWLVVTVISEASSLLSNFNYYYEQANRIIQSVLSKFNDGKISISDNLMNLLRDSAFNILEKFSEYLQLVLTKTVTGITKVPVIAIYVGVSILALYFFCTDKIYMLDELEHHLPENWMKNLTQHIRGIVKVLGGYLKAQFTLIFISFIICLIGLYIFHFIGLNVGFPLIMAILVGFVDALPILGTGTIMIPWGILSSLSGDIRLGIAIIVLWIIMSLVRQFLEPKIVSRKYRNSSNIYNYFNVYRF